MKKLLLIATLFIGATLCHAANDNQKNENDPPLTIEAICKVFQATFLGTKTVADSPRWLFSFKSPYPGIPLVVGVTANPNTDRLTTAWDAALWEAEAVYNSNQHKEFRFD